MSCCCSILTVQRPFVRFFGFEVWPCWFESASSILETRSARRESGRSLKISEAGHSVVSSGRLDLGLEAALA